VEGHTKTDIAQILKKPKSTIQYQVSQLEKKGIVKRVRGSKNPILYARGNNYLKAEAELKKYGENADHQGWLVVQSSPQIRYHRIGYKFKVIKPASRPPPWRRHWTASGVQYHEMEIALENGGNGEKWSQSIRIREVKGKNSTSIIVWLPELVANSKMELMKSVGLKAKQAQHVAHFLQKKFGYQLGIIEEYQEPHFAIPVPRHIAEAATNAGIRTEKVYFDLSPADGQHGDMETHDLRTAIDLMTLPEITAQLAEKADSQEKRMIMMETALKNLVEFSIHQTKIIDSLQKMLTEAKITVTDADTALSGIPHPPRGNKPEPGPEVQ